MGVKLEGGRISGVKESVLALEGNKEGLCYSSGVITTNSNFCGFEELKINKHMADSIHTSRNC